MTKLLVTALVITLLAANILQPTIVIIDGQLHQIGLRWSLQDSTLPPQYTIALLIATITAILYPLMKTKPKISS